MLRFIMQKILPSWMCKEKESIYGAIKFVKNKISYFLWIAWTSQNYETNRIQKEKKQRLNHKIRQNDWKIHRNLQNSDFPFQIDENYSNEIFHPDFWCHLKVVIIRTKAWNYSPKWLIIPQINHYQTF